jgi:hypothetical protein
MFTFIKKLFGITTEAQSANNAENVEAKAVAVTEKANDATAKSIAPAKTTANAPVKTKAPTKAKTKAPTKAKRK